MICSVFLMTTLHNITNGFSLYYLLAKDSDEVAERFSYRQSLTFMVCLWVAVAFNLAVFGFLGHLISFHIYLRRLGITTFEYVRQKENRSRESKIVTLKSKAKIQQDNEIKTDQKLVIQKYNAGCTNVCATCP